MSGFILLHPYLAAQISAGQVSHAYVFSGAEAGEQARAFSAALLCPRPDINGEACGLCPICVNLLAGSYVDCRWIAPQGAAHRVEDMRALVSTANLSPIMGKRKVLIIEQAEKISDEAANTLLKLLEEAAADTTLLLLAAQPAALLPTILSRCQQFVFAGGGGEISLDADTMSSAEGLLRGLPDMPLYQVLIAAREHEKDREGQKLFFFALLKLLHAAARGDRADIAMSGEAMLRSANMVESSLDLLSKNVNQKLLTDIVYLRLWQNCQS